MASVRLRPTTTTNCQRSRSSVSAVSDRRSLEGFGESRINLGGGCGEISGSASIFVMQSLRKRQKDAYTLNRDGAWLPAVRPEVPACGNWYAPGMHTDARGTLGVRITDARLSVPTQGGNLCESGVEEVDGHTEKTEMAGIATSSHTTPARLS